MVALFEFLGLSPQCLMADVEADEPAVDFNYQLPVGPVSLPDIELNVRNGSHYPPYELPLFNHLVKITDIHPLAKVHVQSKKRGTQVPPKSSNENAEPTNSGGSRIDITPDPRILKVLASTPLTPVNALCELIDNALDSFAAARISGVAIPTRFVRIQIPKPGDVERGQGVIRVIDNGVGLDEERLEGALKAGFSDKNKFDSLGLFGVGFNIATAKLGMKTSVTTARQDSAGKLSEVALRAVVDIPKLMRDKSFEIEIEQHPNPQRGTVVEVSGWWPKGDANEKFAYELARMSKPKLLEQLGRRYATILRDDESRVNMTVNDESVLPFEHCVWSETRSKKHKNHGSVPAKIYIDELIRARRRCETDGNYLEEGETSCSQCGGKKLKQVEERVKGWIGVQRYDDKSDFGIDLIRNGRAIRVAEKEAFFTYTNELGQTELEYPIDSHGYGRIVGEIHLDHVPVVYNKENFERATQEWQDAMLHLRGGGLQQKNRPDGEINKSPMGRIFDAYRSTKRFGVEDMYMGVFAEPNPKRISREVEAEFRKKFREGVPGYRDDTEWWKLVEGASIPPITPLNRHTCGAENPEGALRCEGCNEVLIGKKCIECGQMLVISAETCPTCGADQKIVEVGPWKCEACEYLNGKDDETCAQCSLAKGLPNPMAEESLKGIATRADELSFDAMTFKYIDGAISEPVSLSTYLVPKDKLRPFFNQPSIPTYVPVGTAPGKLTIFVDSNHSFFTELGFTTEFAVSAQVAAFLQMMVNSPKNGKSALNMTERVLESVFGERVSINREAVRRDVEALLGEIVQSVTEASWASELSSEMTSEEREQLGEKLHTTGHLQQMEDIKATGEFLRYVPRAICRSYRDEPERWDGAVFLDETDILDDAPSYKQKALDHKRRQILRALEECADFLDSPLHDETVLRRVKSSVHYLNSRLA